MALPVHGFSKSRPPEYRSWESMRARCYNPNDKKYHRYGGRGITICDKWNTFLGFLEDMGPKPSRLHTLDRVNNDLGYCPENCRWSGPVQQGRNKSSTVLNPEAVKVIRHFSSTRGFGIGALLSRLYKVTRSTISAVKYNRLWLDGEES